MSDLIKIPYLELLHRASRIRQEAEAVRTEIAVLTRTVESIHWMGKRAERFFAMWEQARPQMETWAKTLDSFADELEHQARRIQAVDEAF